MKRIKSIGGMRGGPRCLEYFHGILFRGLIWDETFSYSGGEVEFLSGILESYEIS